NVFMHFWEEFSLIPDRRRLRLRDDPLNEHHSGGHSQSRRDQHSHSSTARIIRAGKRVVRSQRLQCCSPQRVDNPYGYVTVIQKFEVEREIYINPVRWEVLAVKRRRYSHF